MVQVRRRTAPPARPRPGICTLRNIIDIIFVCYFVYINIFSSDGQGNNAPSNINQNTEDRPMGMQERLQNSKGTIQKGDENRNLRAPSPDNQKKQPPKEASSVEDPSEDEHLKEPELPLEEQGIFHHPKSPHGAVVTKEDLQDPDKIVHVFYTRFMQHQPDLVELGKARLELFKTFCLPTIKYQTNQQFLWVIRTDPELDPLLKDGLIQSLQGISNVAVIGSNEVRKGSIDGGFRSSAAISDITPESLFLGDMELIQAFYTTARDHTLLETNLDADDGLAVTFVERAQALTRTMFENMSSKKGWLNICVGRHLEWQFYAPWDQNTIKGSLSVGSTHVCITPGLSWATQANATPQFTEAHHMIKRNTTACSDSDTAGLGCWVELPTTDPEKDVMAIRARTPTSTGMSRVFTAESTWSREEVAADISSWPLLSGAAFDINRKSVEVAHKYLDDHLQLVVEENLRGQCTKDHSCSEGIKKKLKNILFKDNQWNNVYGVVHVIQTSLETPLQIDVWRHFCFEAMEAQTSYEFLWIIRIKGYADPVVAKQVERIQMLKILSKSALKVLVVKSDGTPTMDFRHPQSIGDITPETILHGNMAILENYHGTAQNATVLETSVEPFEALSKSFVEDVQKSTSMQLQYSHEEAQNVWYFRCESQFIEWNYFHPQGDESKAGFFQLAGTEGRSCLGSPATTRISLPGAKIPYVTEFSEARECRAMMVLRLADGCFVAVSSEEAQTARALIPESLEKPEPIQWADGELETLEEQDSHLGTVLRYSFNILPYSVEVMHSHIQESQCGDGHDCTSKWDSDHGVVHVISTSLEDPSIFDIWRNFCFSLETQTTKKFLWIIRIAADANADFIKKVVKPLNKTPLNIVVVTSKKASNGYFRQSDFLSEISSGSLLRGDMEMLQYFHQSSQDRPLLETALNPTDALVTTFAEDIQQSTALQIKNKEVKDGKEAWFYRCISGYIEWNYFNPRGGDIDIGFLKSVSPDVSECRELPGTTRISMPSADISDRSHPGPCPSGSGAFTNGCFAPIVPKAIQGARALIPETIDKHVATYVNAAEFRSLEELHTNLKPRLKSEFGIFPVSLKAMRKRIQESGVKQSVDGGAGIKIGEVVETKPTSWSNDRGIVHVIYTRFLQHQPSLTELGKARLELFKTFCVSTLGQQTNKQFLWVIRTDPDLDAQLKESLVQALDGVLNVVVVGSNLGREGRHDGGFRRHDTMKEFTAKSLIYGDQKLVGSYHEASMKHTLLETNLDSDDGVALTFVENTQGVTAESFENDEHNTGWLNLCLGRHMEWHFYAPWEKKSDKGCLLLGSTRLCVKSGMSWATQINAKPNFMEATHLMKDNTPQCSLNRTAADRLFEECWEEVPLPDPENDVMAIRPMTPASNGIARGEISKFDWNIMVLSFDKEAWLLLEPYFAVGIETVKESRRYLMDNMQSVVVDNDRSKCTHEESCAGHWENKYRLVHVIYTSVFDPNLADLLRRVTLSSLVGQTTRAFLLIVRIEDFTDVRLNEMLLKSISDSASADRILLVQSNHTTNFGFRSEQAIADISNKTLLHGEMAVLNDYHRAAQSRPLLETYVRATEGFKQEFVEELQNAVFADIQEHQMQEGSDCWYYQCIPEYFERSYFSPRGDEAKSGFLKIIGAGGSTCMKRPGVTRISLPGAQIPGDTRLSYAQECSPKDGDKKNGCFVQVVSEVPPVLRVLPDLVPTPVQLAEDKIEELESSSKQFQMLRQVRAEFSVFPPTLKIMRQVVQENERQVVHVIHTSLHDPALITPWRHFCIDSLQLQTSKNFLYIIRTSNFTNPRDTYNLMYPLNVNHEKGHVNAIVVYSNHTPAMDFRKPEAIADITNATLFRGDWKILHDFHKAAGGRTVVETFLHPSEGLASTFVADIQKSTETQLQLNQMRGVQLVRSRFDGMLNQWYYRCNPEFVEWTYFTPRGEDTNIGFLKLVGQEKSNCFENPAMTRVTLPGAEARDWTVTNGDSRQCTPGVGGLKDGCFAPVLSDEMQSARALVPQTTESAEPLKLEENEMKRLEAQNEQLSGLLGDSFAIYPYSIEIMRTNIQARQCGGEGKVCTSKFDSPFGSVHVIQTSLQDPAMFDVWRKFCFALESQTTTKFLWILRLASDAKLHKLVLKPINKTPLNIVVVESDYTSTVDFRDSEAVADITKKTLLHGTMEMLEHVHQRAQTRPLLETFLGPTDALTGTFVNDLQKSTATKLKDNHLENGEGAWYYQCVPNYVTWSYFTPRGEETKAGFLTQVDAEEDQCMQHPGLTRISLPGSLTLNDTSRSKECSQGELGKGCFVPLKEEKIQSVRVIVPESTEEAPKVSLSEREYEALEKRQERLGKVLTEEFRIFPVLRNQLQKKMKEIVETKKKDTP